MIESEEERMPRELYELIGDSWRFPIFIRWTNSALAQVSIAKIPILKAQRLAVTNMLRKISDNRTADPEEWFINRTTFENNALRSRHTDPEDVVVWQREEIPLGVLDQDFATAYCAYRHSMPAFRDPEVFSALWDTITKFIREWLLYHGKPVDFGWAKLNVFCARANWKNAVIGHVVGQGYNLNYWNEPLRREVRGQLDLSLITGGHADDGIRTAAFTLDICPNYLFHEAVQTRELKRRADLNGKSYGYAIVKLLKGHLHKDRMYESLRAYAKEAMLPLLDLPRGFVPKCNSEAKPDLDFTPAGHWTQTAVVVGAPKGARPRLSLDPKNEVLPQVQDLQSDDEDLRDARSEMDTAGQSEGGTTGLPLPFAAEKPVASELLPLRHDGGNSGVAPLAEQLPDPNGKNP